MRTHFLLIATLLLLGLLPAPTRANTTATSGNHLECVESDVVRISGVVDTGVVRMCVSAPTSVRTGENFTVAVDIDGPILLSLLATTAITADVVNAHGCFTEGQNLNSIPMFTDSFGGTSSQGFTENHMKDKECDFAVRGDVQVSIGGALDFRRRFTIAVNIGENPCGQLDGAAESDPNRQCYIDSVRVYHYGCAATEAVIAWTNPQVQPCQEPQVNNLNYLCAATNAVPDAFSETTTTCTPPTLTATLTGQLSQLSYQCAATGGTPNAFNPATTTCLTPQVDNLVRLCAASAFGAACTTPTINAAVTGTLTATLAGTLDVLTRLCAASTTGSACTPATINTVVSGTLDNLNRICDDSNFGTACNELHFTADLLARVCAASTYNTTCTAPTVNAILSGAITAALSGTVHPCSTALLAADPHACDINSNSSINVTTGGVNVTLPMELLIHVCGPSILNGTCTPVQATAIVTAHADFPTLTFLIVVTVAALASWLFCASTYLVVRLLGIILLTFDGFYALIRFADLPQGYWLAILCWLFAALFFFWLALQEVMRNIARLKNQRAQAQATEDTLE